MSGMIGVSEKRPIPMAPAKLNAPMQTAVVADEFFVVSLTSAWLHFHRIPVY